MRWIDKALLGTCIALALVGCNDDGQSVTQPPAEHAMLEGVLRLPDGKPAAGATLRFYTVDHVPGQRAGAKVRAAKVADYAYSARTDAEGRYSVNSLPKGEYNILGEKDGLVSFEDSVFLMPGNSTALENILAAAGAVTARVRLQPHHDARSVTVHVLGTNVYSNVDGEGRFTLAGLAAGRYNLRIETTREEYTVRYASLEVKAGRADSLEKPIALDFTGIPVVEGLAVSLDTLAGTARLSWSKADYSHRKAYVISRSPREALVPQWTTVGITSDTTWSDQLYDAALTPWELESENPSVPRSWEYRVRVRNLSGEEGDFYGTTVLDAVPPSAVTTVIDFERLGTIGGEASIDDTLRLVAHFRNPTRRLVNVIWREAGKDDPLREKAFKDVEAGSDTLTVVGARLESRTFHFQVWDDARKPWEAPVGVRFVADPPMVSAGRDTVLPHGQTLRLHGSGVSRFQGMKRMEWDIGAKGTWKETPDGALDIILPDTIGMVTCVFRAENQDGDVRTDTVKVRAGLNWRKVDDVPFLGNNGNLVVFKDRIWMIGGQKKAEQKGMAWSSADGIVWREERGPEAALDRMDGAAYVLRDTLWVVGGSRPYMWNPDQGSWFTADGITWEHWHEPTGIPGVTKAVQYGGKVYLSSEHPGILFESTDGRNWTTVHTDPQMGQGRLNVMVATPLGFLVGGYSTRWVWFYQGEPEFRKWPVDPMEALGANSPVAVWYRGRIYVLGGRKNRTDFGTWGGEEDTDRVYSSLQGFGWDPEPKLWRRIRPNSAAAVFQDRIWVADQGQIIQSY